MMKSTSAIWLVTLFSVALAQGPPSCLFSDCMASWFDYPCDQQPALICLCSNSTAIAQINSCVEKSCTKNTDQQTIFGGIAQICANNGKIVTNSEEATFSATSGGTLLPSMTGPPAGWASGGSWNSASMSSWISSCSSALGGMPSSWHPGPPWSAGSGPWGSGGSGFPCDPPWKTWSTGDGLSSTGSGTWSSWSTTTTSSGSTITKTTTSSTFGAQAAAQSTNGASNSNAATPTLSTFNALGVFGSFAAVIFGLMVGL